MNRLCLLPLDEYIGVNHDDPLFLYYYPLVGKFYRKRIELCLNELKGGQRVLEIGFGAGLTFLNLQEEYDEIYGLDLTSDVELIAAMFRKRHIETHLQNGNVLEMPYPNDYFDSVLLISILEHLQPKEQETAFQEIFRVLKPGGQVVYGVPVERPLMVLAFRLLGYDIRKLHFSTENDVSKAAQKNLSLDNKIELKGLWGLSDPIYQICHLLKMSDQVAP